MGKKGIIKHEEREVPEPNNNDDSSNRNQHNNKDDNNHIKSDLYQIQHQCSALEPLEHMHKRNMKNMGLCLYILGLNILSYAN